MKKIPVLPLNTSNQCANQPITVSISPQQSEFWAEILHAAADKTRIAILDLLAQTDSYLCVCDITSQFQLNQPTISHHLRILREANLIQKKMSGVWAHYQITQTGRDLLAAIYQLHPANNPS